MRRCISALWSLPIRTQIGRIKRNRKWLLSLGPEELIALILEPDTGLDQEDKEALVQLAFGTYPKGSKSAIIARLAKHLTREFKN